MSFEKLTYINHQNERFEFGNDGIFVNTTELRNYQWEAQKRNEHITGFDTKISKYKIPVKIICKTEAEAIAAKNKLYEVTEKDVLANEYGKIVIGDYYFKCFVMQSKKKDYLMSSRYMHNDLTVTTDYPFWVREHKYIFAKGGFNETGQNLDYPFDYPFDYKSAFGAVGFPNKGVWTSNFRIVIYGVCTDPEIRINGHMYKVTGDIGVNEYLTIDSATKEIYLTTNIGNRVNRFNDRYRRSYIFEQIPAGMINVLWDGTFAFDLYIMDERREPKWS